MKRNTPRHFDWLAIMGLYESLVIVATDDKGVLIMIGDRWSYSLNCY